MLALVSLAGPHGTDISLALLAAAAAHAVPIRDLSFARLRHHVAFSLLVPVDAVAADSPFIAAVRAAAARWDASVDVRQDAAPVAFARLDDAPYERRVKYAATVLDARPDGITTAFLHAWNQLLIDHGVSIEAMARLNDARPPPHPALVCLDYRLSVPASLNLAAFRDALFALARNHATDIALQPNNVFRRHKRLVVFDMDSTLVQHEVIDELARQVGVLDRVADITHRAMMGELDFAQSLAQRVALLKDAPIDIVQRVRDSLLYTPGAHTLCRALKRLGLKLAVISGGFLPMALRVKHDLGLDYAFANTLALSPDQQRLAGHTIGPIVDAARKAELLRVIAQAEGIELDQVIAIGDGANDLLMLDTAGLGVAFNAKPRVQERAATAINQPHLDHVLYLMGYSDQEIAQLVND